MPKILSIFDTRPEEISTAPLVEQLEKDSVDFESLICVTAQHRSPVKGDKLRSRWIKLVKQ